jgi:hypothetical protein
MKIIRFEWVVPESKARDHLEEIEVDGGDVEASGEKFQPRPDEAGDYTAAGFEPLTMIVAAASVVFVAQAIHRMLRDNLVRGGTFVDTRGGKLRIRPVPAMPTGRLVIAQDSGVSIFDKDEENAGKQLLSEVLGRFGKASI